MLLQSAIEILWLLLPAMVANMAPVVITKTPLLQAFPQPISPRLLGTHKTWLGLVSGAVFGSVTGFLQWLVPLQAQVPFALVLWPTAGQALLFGAWLGLAALLGDAVKSFIKRRYSIAPGKPWVPWDQIDFVIAVLIAAQFFTSITFAHIVVALVAVGFGSRFVSKLGVALNIKKSL